MSDFFEFSLLTVWSVNVFVEVNLSVPRERCSSVRVSGFQSPCPTGWDAPWLNYNNVGGSSFFVYMENIIGSAAACVQYFMAQFLQNWWRTSRLPPHRREHVAVFHWVIKYCSELWGSLRCIDTTVCFVLSEPGMSWREWGKKKNIRQKKSLFQKDQQIKDQLGWTSGDTGTPGSIQACDDMRNPQKWSQGASIAPPSGRLWDRSSAPPPPLFQAGLGPKYELKYSSNKFLSNMFSVF